MDSVTLNKRAMLSIKPTPTGIGVEITSSGDIMRKLYDLTYDILNIDYQVQEGPEDTRGDMIQAFAYDIRHAFMDAEFLAQQGKLVPCSIKLIWPDIIIYLMCLRQKAAYVSLKPEQLALLDHLENELKKAMYEYDSKSAANNEHLVQPLFDLTTDFLFLLQHHLHNEYINTKPRKTAFKHLATMMHQYLDFIGIERQLIEAETKASAKKYECSIRELKAASEYLEVKRW